MSNRYPHPYDYYSVIKEIDPKSIVRMNPDDLSTLEWLDGNPNNITTEQIEEKKIELIADWESKTYQFDRQIEYPSTGEQLDYIYHNGVEKWKTDMIDPVKNKYPKPEEDN